MKWGRPLRRRPFDRERGAMKISKMLLAAMILAVTGNVRAHDWYPKECCGGHDCAPAKANPGYASARPAAADDAAVGDDDHHQARHGHRTERLQGARVEGWTRSCVYHQDGLRAGPPDVPLAAAKHLMDGFQQGGRRCSQIRTVVATCAHCGATSVASTRYCKVSAAGHLASERDSS